MKKAQKTPKIIKTKYKKQITQKKKKQERRDGVFCEKENQQETKSYRDWKLILIEQRFRLLRDCTRKTQSLSISRVYLY